ncbi:hypothetical protein tca_00464 [Methanothermobacter sp. EMTCatA1]|jgi:hypothetical protein|nr:hypothetical protein tca_00464 [Methanothermobacter sp. EMTCatA1]
MILGPGVFTMCPPEGPQNECYHSMTYHISLKTIGGLERNFISARGVKVTL